MVRELRAVFYVQSKRARWRTFSRIADLRPASFVTMIDYPGTGRGDERGQDAPLRQMGFRRLGTKSSQTRRWRKMDSNHRSLVGRLELAIPR